MKKGCWFGLSLLIILLDQVSKYWVSITLIPYKPFPVLPFFNLTFAYNTGAAFGFLSAMGDWHRWFFSSFSFCVSVVLMVWLWRAADKMLLQSAGLSLILGGAVGNLIDRAIHGYVIDFIDLYYKNHHFATFNIADSAICLGAACLVLDLLGNRQ